MHRRARHLKPSSFASTIAYDSRYITDSDGTAIETWTDKSGNSRDFTQSTSSKKPIFKTAIQGGCGILRFDGTDDSMSTSSYSVSSVVSSVIVLKVGSILTGSIIFERSSNPNANNGAYSLNTSDNLSWDWFVKTSGASTGYVASSFTTRNQTFSVLALSYNNSDSTFFVNQNGNVLTKINLFTDYAIDTVNAPSFLASRNDSSLFIPMDIGILNTINSDIGDPMRKRLNHHAAFSFKIACS